MAPSNTCKPQLTISTAVDYTGLGQAIIPGLGEPYVSRTAHMMERQNPNATFRPVVPFSRYTNPLNRVVATRPSVPVQVSSRFKPAMEKFAAEEAKRQREEGTEVLRAMLRSWAEEERKAKEAETEPFPRFDSATAEEMMREEEQA